MGVSVATPDLAGAFTATATISYEQSRLEARKRCRRDPPGWGAPFTQHESR